MGYTVWITVSKQCHKGWKVWVKKQNLGKKTLYLNYIFFGHNFWTTNIRKPIKGSKDSYYNLVSKNLSQKIGS